MINTKIYKYYNELDYLNKIVFLDLINDLISWINVINKLKNDYSKLETDSKNYFSDLELLFKEKWLSRASWFIFYKKLDYYTNEDIKKNYNTNLSETLSKLSLKRRLYILKLIEKWVIKDIWINLLNLYDEEEIINEWWIIENWKMKQFNFQLADNVFKEIFSSDKIKNWEKLWKNDIESIIDYFLLKELRNYYWEDQLNKELNYDNSYKENIFYISDIKDLNQLYNNLKYNSEKEILDNYKFKDWNLIINWNNFIIKNAKWTNDFIKLISHYFEENKNSRVSITKLIDFYCEIKKEKNIDKLNLTSNNIKNSYIETFNKNLNKQYINNWILKIKWNDIVLM